MKFSQSLLPIGAAALLSAMPMLGHAFTVPEGNVPESGAPGFSNQVRVNFVNLNNGTYQLTASTNPGSFTFNDGSSNFPVNQGTFILNAAFTKDSSGYHMLSGFVDIDGQIPTGANAGSYGNLFHASLTGDFGGFNSALSPNAWGFETDVSTFGGWAAQYSAGFDESVYLSGFLLNSIDAAINTPTFKSISFNASAVTTVPVPAAVWLLGSALAAVSVVSRREKVSA